MVRLIKNPRLRHQLISLHRATRSGGRDKIDHPTHGYDDLINAAAGACLVAHKLGAVLPVNRLQSHGIDAHDIFATPEENAALMRRAESQQRGRFSGPGWAPTWHGEDQQTVGLVDD